VPNLGQDRDIKGHFEDLDLAEKMVGHHLVMGTKESKDKWKNPAKKVDYDFAPKLDIDMRRTESSIDQIETREGHKFEPWNFVQTESEVQSDPVCSSAGCTQYKHPKKERGYDIDYPVVNLGTDKDISDHFTDLALAEKIVGHKWDFKLEKPPINPAKKTLYDYNPTLDGDMITAKHSLDLAEDITGKHYAEWMGVQTDADLQSDPVCSSAGCWHSAWFKHQSDKVIQYPDPVADGYDKDIAVTLKNEKEASANLGINWNPWDGASNAPKPKGPARVRSVSEIMDWIKEKEGAE